MPRENVNTLLTGSFTGLTLEYVLNCLQESLQLKTANNGKGLKFLDENETERVRFMLPNNEQPNYYWVRQSNRGVYLDESGAEIPSSLDRGEHRRLRHIPYTGSDDPLEYITFGNSGI